MIRLTATIVTDLSDLEHWERSGKDSLELMFKQTGKLFFDQMVANPECLIILKAGALIELTANVTVY